MRCRCGGDAVVDFGQPRDDTAGGEIDVQIHQLLGRGALAICQAEHLMVYVPD